MPKLSYRCNRRGQLPQVATVAFCAPPRKVSFEDGHSDSDSSQPASPARGTDPALLSKEAASLTPKLPTLRRPKSSLSLVEMAKGVESDDGNDQNNKRKHTSDEDSFLLVSPTTGPLGMEMSPSPQTPPTSPWGYFVDMVIPLDDATREPPQQRHVYQDGPCSCCSSCRRWRASPYGDYKKQRRSSLCFQAHRSIPLPASIRLPPRRKQEPADQLVGALDRLQVD